MWAGRRAGIRARRLKGVNTGRREIRRTIMHEVVQLEGRAGRMEYRQEGVKAKRCVRQEGV